jgi:hypothetical protein
MTDIKFPKQWKHWAKLAGLKPYTIRGGAGNFGFTGRGRHWRVSRFGDFQSSFHLRDFDRWSNSILNTYRGIPQTQAEFFNAVEYLTKEL